MLVDVAHGQMTSDELDDIFRRFKMGGFHVLVATTIIDYPCYCEQWYPERYAT